MRHQLLFLLEANFVRWACPTLPPEQPRAFPEDEPYHEVTRTIGSGFWITIAAASTLGKVQSPYGVGVQKNKWADVLSCGWKAWLKKKGVLRLVWAATPV